MEMEKEASATEACQKLHKLLEACQGGRVRSEKETGGGGGGCKSRCSGCFWYTFFVNVCVVVVT
jgi:hypothetical protein